MLALRGSYVSRQGQSAAQGTFAHRPTGHVRSGGLIPISAHSITDEADEADDSETDLRVVSDQIEELLAQLQRSLDPVQWGQTQRLVGLVTDLYGGGLDRVLDLADIELRQAMADDDLLASLMVLHDLHPLSLDERVQGALESVRPYLASHGGDVAITNIDPEAGVVTVEMLGSCDGCASSATTLDLAVERAILEAAPEIRTIALADDAASADEPASSGVGPTPVALGRKPTSAAANTRSSMAPIYGLRALAPGRVGPLDIEGNKIIVCRVGSQLYAYRSSCPECSSSLDKAVVDDSVLRCPGCNAAFDIPRAGRSLDGKPSHLDPLPLIEEGGEVHIAVAALS